MAGSTAEDVVDRVNRRIEAALRRNSRLEWWIIVLLVMLFLVGIALLITAAIIRRFEVALVGCLLELAVAFPIHQLVRLRRENVRLEIIPELIEYAGAVDSDEAKRLVFVFIVKLIERI